jgi:hypothetical protein
MFVKCALDAAIISRLQMIPSRAVGSRAVYYSGGLGGRVGNWVEGPALQRIPPDLGDEIKHLAKVRVGGSNPVFRSLNGVF